MKRNLKTNEDLVLDLMRYSPHGALCQAFIINAIEAYCDSVAKTGPEAFDGGLINGQAWVDIAKDVKSRIREFYK